MRLFALLSLVSIAACTGASHSPATIAPESERVRVGGATTTSGLRLTSSAMARVDTLWTSLDRVWKTMPAVYATLEIPIERFDAEANTIGSSGLKLYRRLGGVALTKYLDCGHTQIGPNADSYEVRLSVLTKLQKAKPDTGNTTVSTMVEATARPIQFAGDPVRCSSKGALEARIAEVLRIQIAPAP